MQMDLIRLKSVAKLRYEMFLLMIFSEWRLLGLACLIRPYLGLYDGTFWRYLTFDSF